VKKILITNNSNLVDEKYNQIYTDSPYVVDKYNNAKYLDTVLDKNFNENLKNLQTNGYSFNQKIIDKFFPDYSNRNINILNISMEFTTLFVNIVKLFKLIELYPYHEITIKITEDELYNYESENALDRFVNTYYWIAEIIKSKRIKLECKRIKSDISMGHLPSSHWFLRLIDLDTKVILFNILKKFNLINKNKKKIYLYKDSNYIREIEPYLYDLGFNLIKMPPINFVYNKINNDFEEKKLKDLLDLNFNNSIVYSVFKKALFVMFKKRICYYSQKKKFIEEYLSKLNSSIKFILTNTIIGFDSDIFAKQLQQHGFKIINMVHGFTSNFRRKEHFDFIECLSPDMTLCFNQSEKNLYKELSPKSIIYPISLVQEAKKKRLGFLKRIYVNKIFKIKENINIFYPSVLYPLNNVTKYGYRRPDKLKYNTEKKLIDIFSNLNKRVIYKSYPKRAFIDPNPLVNYAKTFKNIRVIDDMSDFRFMSSIGDIFFLQKIGTSSTLTWMLGENKPIIFLYNSQYTHINEHGKKILDKTLIVVNENQENWSQNLSNLLNKPYKELVKIWNDKKIYRDKYDEEWLMGNNIHAGRLGAQYIKDFHSKEGL
jgi:hypothetical protein